MRHGAPSPAVSSRAAPPPPASPGAPPARLSQTPPRDAMPSCRPGRGWGGGGGSPLHRPSPVPAGVAQGRHLCTVPPASPPRPGRTAEPLSYPSASPPQPRSGFARRREGRLFATGAAALFLFFFELHCPPLSFREPPRGRGRGGCVGWSTRFSTTKTHLIPCWHIMPNKRKTVGMS